MSGYSSSESRWHEDCFGRCDSCATCLHQGNNDTTNEGHYRRFMTMGSVRYGMRLGAVSPPPPGAGPRYRSHCCWPTTPANIPGNGPVSRIPLFSTAPINSLDIISCANRMRMTEDATSELPQQAPVRDHVLYSTKCLLKSQLKRCAFVRPQIYARLCEFGEINEEEDIINNLDRLPRFRFGGNRASTTKIRDYDKRNDHQKLKDLTNRFKRGPIPPSRLRHQSSSSPPPPPPPSSSSSSSLTPPTSSQSHEHQQQQQPPSLSSTTSQISIHDDDLLPPSSPLRSASFSQVDYNIDDHKYVRRRNQPNHKPYTSTATLPRSKPTKFNIEAETSNLNSLYEMLKNDNISNSNEIEENDINEITVIRNTTLAPPNLEKKRDKSRRRKGIYISQWPNSYNSNDNSIPQFVNDDNNDNNVDFGSCSQDNTKILENSINNLTKLTDDKSNNCNMWSNQHDESLTPEDNNIPPEWLNYDKDNNNSLKISKISLRSDSLSEGEIELSERKSDQIYLVPSDLSDCESRLSIGNDTISPRRYSKRPLRGPYGQMLEAEMKKPETRKNLNTDLKFLEDLTNTKPKYRTRTSCNNSIDDTKQLQGLSKRKVSADNLIVPIDNEQKFLINHQRTTSSPSKLEGFANNDVVSNELFEQLLAGSSEQLATSDANQLQQQQQQHQQQQQQQQQQQNDTRTHVVVELYDNEIIYVESLQTIVTKYLEPLKTTENALLEPSLVNDIFCQIPIILKHHEIFLEELKKRLDHWDGKQKIGDVFLNTFSKPSLIESYSNYVNNWKRNREIIKNAQSSKPAFSRFLEATAREHKGKLALDSLLIKPIQKFPKYELLIQRLLKHTGINHPDHNLLLAAQKEIHDQLLKINCNEREALELEQLREIESIIEGLIDLVSSDRQFLRHDSVNMSISGGPKKERTIFLFSDLLVVTSTKRKSGTIRKPPPVVTSQSNISSTLEANKYKLLMKIPLEDLEIVKTKDENLKQIMLEIENLTEDVGVLNQITELSWNLHCNHSQLDDVVRDMLALINKQLTEHQNCDSQLSCIDLTLNTPNSVENISIVFPKTDKRTSWEEMFNEAKHKLAMSGDRKPCPELLAAVPIRKTRAGLQFTCAAPTLGDNGRDVWVCNSDGYVGQVCVLSLQPEPTVTSCNGVCNARILCISSVPGVSYSLSVNNKNTNLRDELYDEHPTIHFDSSSSCDEDDKSENDDNTNEPQKLIDIVTTSLENDDIDNQQSTMWLGTEDGYIHVYNASDNIRIKKNKIRLQHGSPILCIIYIENRVFVSLANGDITIYNRDNHGGWNINSPTTITVGSTSAPASKMLPNGIKLWCTCGNIVKIFNTQTLTVENSFTVFNDSNKPIYCMVIFGNAVWLSLQNSALVKCFHTFTFEQLCEINVAPAVTKMLTSCDDIIRQHKAACLRVTSILACKDLLWIGTSAGVLLTMPLPHITSTTTKLLNIPTVTGVSHGHTGHVRFLTYVELNHNNNDNIQQTRNSFKSDNNQTRNSTNKLLIISGGDGYEDFRNSNLSEVAGREDSTNHLLLWNI